MRKSALRRTREGKPTPVAGWVSGVKPVTARLAMFVRVFADSDGMHWHVTADDGGDNVILHRANIARLRDELTRVRAARGRNAEGDEMKGRYPITAISNDEMDEAIKREREVSALRIIGYPLYRSPDGRLYPLPNDDVVVDGDTFTIWWG